MKILVSHKGNIILNTMIDKIRANKASCACYKYFHCEVIGTHIIGEVDAFCPYKIR